MYKKIYLHLETFYVQKHIKKFTYIIFLEKKNLTPSKAHTK